MRDLLINEIHLISGGADDPVVTSDGTIQWGTTATSADVALAQAQYDTCILAVNVGTAVVFGAFLEAPTFGAALGAATNFGGQYYCNETF